MLSLNSVAAWIEVDGKELEQYGIEEDPEHNQVTCWVAAQADKGFSIVFTDNVQYRTYSLVSSIQLDGSLIRGKILQRSLPGVAKSNSIAARTSVQTGQRVSATSLCPFLFSKLELTDEDEFLNQSSTMLGEIQVRIRRAELLHVTACRPVPQASGHAKVHERSKKAVTHCVSYGQEVKTRMRKACHVRYPDADRPLVTFIFKYRDLGLLQANGIAPKPPPVKKRATISGEVLDLTIRHVKPELVDEEIEIIDKRGSKRPKPRHDGDSKPVKRIKREHVFTGEVIDLT